MHRYDVTCLLLIGLVTFPVPSSAEDAQPRTRKKSVEAEQPLEVRNYPVADLVVPIPNFPSKAEAEFDKSCKEGFLALEQHLRHVTGKDVWNDSTSMKPYATTLSLVVRQTAGVHEKLAEELSRLRHELDAQVALEIRVITGPRDQIASLAEAFPGELGQFETEQLLKRAEEWETLQTVFAPKITLFSRQSAQVAYDGRMVSANAVVSADRRSIQLKVSDNSEKEVDVLRNLKVVRVHSGRSVALRFEALSVASLIPPAPDATERLLVISPKVILQEEEEQKVVITVTPHMVIQPEEEELLGISIE